MRNQVIFDDYEIPTLSLHLTKDGGNSHEFSMQTQTHFVETGTDAVQTTDISIQANLNKPTPGESVFYASTQDQQLQKRVIRFLRRVVPLLNKQIQESSMQIAYQNYNPDVSQIQDQTKLITTLQNFLKDTGSMSISDIDWNSTGTTLAISYSESQHQGSCNHKSMICSWNLFKKGIHNAVPQIIQTNGCISCIKFHPIKSSIIACGSFSGEIFLYDIERQDDNLIAKSTIDQYFHREAVTKLLWQEDRIPGNKQIYHNLLSLSTDGKILLWQTKLNEKKQYFQFPLKGFSLVRKRGQDILPVGALTMQESSRGRNQFVIGSQGGSLLQATLSEINHQTKIEGIINSRKGFNYHRNINTFLINLPQKKLHQVLNALQNYATSIKSNSISLQTIYHSKLQKMSIYPNCISFVYEPSVSPITSISINQYGLICVNGYEGLCKIYEQKVKQPIQTIDGGAELQWIAPSKLAGFFGDQWMIVDWLTEEVISRIQIMQGIKWTRKRQLVAIACDTNKVKLVKINGAVFQRQEKQQENVRKKILNLKGE